MSSKGLLLLLWVCFVHLAGIYLFTGGFLLTRLSLSESSSCPTGSCTLTPTHSRAILLIIDALRFDFLSPEPPHPSSQFHHNILTLPRELTASHPQNSFLFNAYADPPTTTLQRIKGLTTGSLPTFVDLGNNFGGSSIAEDSILKQLRAVDKKVAFMGDDTWMSVFPDSFQPNMTFPYDSFNVEDLHTVDEGVIANIFPLLEDKSKPFDFLIGHFLGVDHVGHRVGPDHPSMKAKLEQMNDVLGRVVDLLEDDTLLVVLGDHGMDRSGDHGGDGELETSAGMWIYSKGPSLSEPLSSIPSSLLTSTIFPGESIPHRSIQQIDLLPTLSLLLGLPIPFNNLGTIVPELFTRGTNLVRALELNAAQIKSYLDTYRSSPSGGELDDSWPTLQSAWKTTNTEGSEYMNALYDYNRLALSTCRSLWAQFNPLLMSMGLALLGISVIATWSVYSRLSNVKKEWDDWISVQLWRCLRSITGGAILGVLIYLPFHSLIPGIDALDCILFFAPLASCIFFIFTSSPNFSIQTLRALPLPLLLHAASFLSNSFTFWEDRLVPFLLLSSIVPSVIKGFTAPTSRLRYRILGFSLLFGVCVRLMSISTICREEQQPYCHVTFYASSSLPSPPLLVLLLSIPASLGIPWAVQRFLRITRSDMGIFKTFLPSVLRPALLAGTAFWIIEWADSAGIFGGDQANWSKVLRRWRTWLSWGVFLGVPVVGSTLWWAVPICLDVVEVDVDNSTIIVPNSTTTGGGQKKRKQVQVIGFANAFGSPYLLFWSLSFCLVYITTQLTGQLTLGLAIVALLAHLEVVDSVRDVYTFEEAFTSATPSAILQDLHHTSTDTFTGRGKQSPAVKFADIVPIALLGLQAFYATGHQAVISSIQWKSGFMLTESMTFLFSGLTVVLNSVGPLFLVGLAVPLVALWNRAPLPPVPNASSSRNRASETSPAPDDQVQRESILAGLGMMIYYATLLLGTAVSAAILRRHLMVWKVFAPRFMAAVLGVIVVDLGVLFGVGVGVERVGRRVGTMFDVRPRKAE